MERQLLEVWIPAVISALLFWEGVQGKHSGYSLKASSPGSVQEGHHVNIPCTFTYDPADDDPHAPLYGYWYAEDHPGRPSLVATNNPERAKDIEPHIRGRFEVSGPDLTLGDCSLSIKDVEVADQATYHFRMEKGRRARHSYSAVEEKVALIVTAVFPLEPEDIINGYECRPHSVPWQVYLTDGRGGFCGGSLIHERWIVSAAHCFFPSNTIIAHLGKHNIKHREVTERNRKAALVIRHPYYNHNTLENDIMLVKLAQPVDFNQYVARIQLPSRCPGPGNWCLVSGWGQTQSGRNAERLQCLKEPILPDMQCKQHSRLPYNSNSNLCVGYMQGGKGTCRGDSGGPFVCNGQLHGINSKVYTCATKGIPTIYTKVCYYTRWIRQIMSKY